MLKMLHDRVLIKKFAAESISKGGVIIPDAAKEKPLKGTVIRVGDGIRDSVGNLIPLQVKEGDGVYFSKWGGSEIELDGEQYVIMKESDIVGIVE